MKIKKTHSSELTALVVEDSIVNQRQLKIHLSKMGFNIVFADNGLDAVEKIETMLFDIVFLDVMIPKLNGYKVCKIIKKNPETRGIPVIMLTSRDGAFDKVRGKMSGSNEYLTKPLKAMVLEKTIGKYFPLLDGKLAIGVKEIQTTNSNHLSLYSNTTQINPLNYSDLTSRLLKHRNDSAFAMKKAKERIEHFRRLAEL